MKVSKVQLTADTSDNKRLAFGQIVLGKEFVVTGVSVFSGEKGNFVRLPQYKDREGNYHDVAFPTKADLRKEINAKVLEQYEKIAA